MGLFLAKEYIKNEGLQEGRGLPLEYRGSRFRLEEGVRFLCPDDDYIELRYTGDEIKVTYGNNDSLMMNCVNGTLTLTFIKTDKENSDNRSMIYPLTMVVSDIKILRVN
jgi:hypothetical protein